MQFHNTFVCYLQDPNVRNGKNVSCGKVTVSLYSSPLFLDVYTTLQENISRNLAQVDSDASSDSEEEEVMGGNDTASDYGSSEGEGGSEGEGEPSGGSDENRNYKEIARKLKRQRERGEKKTSANDRKQKKARGAAASAGDDRQPSLPVELDDYLSSNGFGGGLPASPVANSSSSSSAGYHFPQYDGKMLR